MQLLEVSLRDTAPTDQAIAEEVEMHSGQYFMLKNTITILIKGKCYEIEKQSKPYYIYGTQCAYSIYF